MRNGGGERMRSQRAARVLLALGVALLVAGCGGGGGGGGGGGKAGGGAKKLKSSDAQNASGNISWCIGKDTTGAFSQVVKLHNQQNPNVKVKLIELPTSADEQRTQQIQRLRAKSPECDVLGIDTIWTAEYASQGWVYDVSDVINDRKSEFIGSTVDSAKYNGKYWAIPFNTNAGFLYYRTDQVSSAPSTWQQVYQEAQQKNGIVYQGARYEGLTVDYLELLYSAGGKVLSDDGKSVEIDSPEARDTLDLMKSGIKDGAAPRAVTTYMEEESRRAFEAGRATFLRNWPYVYSLANKSPIKGKFALSPLPKWEGAKASGVIGGYNLAISVYSKHPGAALEFVNFVTKPNPQKIMATKASLPPTLSATYDDPAVKKALPFAGELRKAVAQAQPRPISPVYPQISEAIYKNVYSALSGGTSSDAAVKKMKSQIEAALKTF
jgi:multiple sugar transport system substrate-binding protein